MPEKNICILSHGPIANDGRILKTIDFSLSRDFSIWVLFPAEEPFKELVKINPGITLKPIKKRNSLFRKILRHTIYPLEFSYLATEANKLDHRFDYIYVNDLPSLHAGLKIKKRNTGSKLIYDSHEIFNETVNQFFPSDAGVFRSLIFKGLIRIMRFLGTWMERKMVKKADLFITVNESLKDYFQRKYRVSNVKVMMNCPSIKKSDIEQEVQVDFLKKYVWTPDTRVFLYQGAFNKGRGIELLIRTFRKTPDHFRLILIGHGVLGVVLKKMVLDLNLEDKIKFEGFVPNQHLQFYTKAADVGINLLEPFNLSKAMASPNKLFEYIHAGIPVVCSDTQENKKVISQFDIGVLVKNSEESLLDGLLFYKDEENIQKKKNPMKVAASHYTWENQLIVLEDFFPIKSID